MLTRPLPPAPLDPVELEPVLRSDYGAVRTLPARAYTSDEVLAWERRHLFEGGWVCIGRADLVPHPRDQRALLTNGLNVLVTRDEEGAVHAFHNSCRHRGHELVGVGECVSRRHIACPYHSWAYALDGRLRSATRFSEVPGFDPDDYPLRGMAIEEWRGWLFLNVSGEALPLAEWVGNLDELLDPWPTAAMTIQARHEYVVKANWKTIVENYLECYHCPAIHPELCRVSPPDSGTPIEPTGMWIGGHMELADHAETMSLDGKSNGTTMSGMSGPLLRQIHYYALFPSILISPHPDYVMTHRLEPISPNETYVECAWLFTPETVEHPGFTPSFAEDFWHLTNMQDFNACESVARALDAGAYCPGPLDYREAGVRRFMGSMARVYQDGALEPPALIDVAVW
jgi:Rieske 2Fe-2S family protein